MAVPPHIDLPGSLQNFAWSPDGKSLSFTLFHKGYNNDQAKDGEDATADIYTLELASGKLTALVADGAENVSVPGACQHPDGGVLYSGGTGAHDEIFAFRNGAPVQLTSRADAQAWEPAWAPDGQSIVFESHAAKGDPGPGQIITHKIGTDQYPPITDAGRDCRQPNWSWDGRYIVFQEQVAKDDWRIKVYEIAIRKEWELAKGTDATFSPDSAHVLFSNDDDPGRLAIVPVTGGDAVLAGGAPGYQGAPSWSPDSKTIACEASDRDPDGGPGTKLAFIDVSGLSITPQQPPPQNPSLPMSSTALLDAMQTLVGTKWESGAPTGAVRAWLEFIASKYPKMRGYINDLEIGYEAWCAIGIGYCATFCGYEPPFGPADVDKFAYVDAWLKWTLGTLVTHPQRGDIIVVKGGGIHHITLFLEDLGNGYWKCLGANQSHEVKESNYRAIYCTAIRPPGADAQPSPAPVASYPEIEIGATGSAVSELQHILGIGVDADFGPDTDKAVREFQAAHGLDVDGVVGRETWAALLSGKPVPTSSSTSLQPLAQSAIDKIVALARASSLASYRWLHSRGQAPVGYINGMAVAYGTAYLKFKLGDPAAKVAASARGDVNHDALAWYGVNVTAGVSALRAAYVLLTGLGMMESSGEYWQGRDTTSKEAPTADTSEAGIFQQSWNSHVASPELPRLLAAWSADTSAGGYLSIFRERVHAGSSVDIGSGDGARFQRLCKQKPLFAVECAAVGIRTIGGQAPYGHWGPIRRKDAEMRPEADALFRQVEAIVDATPAAGSTPTPTPTPTPVPLPDDEKLRTALAPITAAIEADCARINQVVTDLKVMAADLNTLKGNKMTTDQTQSPTSTAQPSQLDLVELARQFANAAAAMPQMIQTMQQQRQQFDQVIATLKNSGMSLPLPVPPVAGAGGAAEALPSWMSLIGQLYTKLGTGAPLPLIVVLEVVVWILQSAGQMGTISAPTQTAVGMTVAGGLHGITALVGSATFQNLLKAFTGFLSAMPKPQQPAPAQ
jgi:peptidoglycan hydrolase-like protein with peptidoglycan-binding domain